MKKSKGIIAKFTNYDGLLETKKADEEEYTVKSKLKLDGEFSITYNVGSEKRTYFRYVGKLDGKEVNIYQSHIPGIIEE